jgi:hypothetical protein
LKTGGFGIEIDGTGSRDTIMRADEVMGVDKNLPIESSRETSNSEKP